MYLRNFFLASSAIGLAAIFSTCVSNAEDQPQKLQQRMERQGGDTDCMGNQDCGQKNSGEQTRTKNKGDNDAVQKKDDDKGSTRKSRAQRDDDNNKIDNNRGNRRQASNWKYDPQRNHRSRNKDSRYRFYLGGYYYDQPYWDSPSIELSLGNGRVSCGEGQRIVNDSGFNPVRTVECSGRTFTYTGRRDGDTFRVTLNSRNGRIVSAKPL
jgi:hypothetical protein